MRKCSALLKWGMFISFPTERIRLVNGASFYSGKVEVYYNGAWESICTNGWDMMDADVVCRELGFHGAMRTLTNDFYEGYTYSLFTSVGCSGHEESLFDCSKSYFEYCYYKAGVTCIRKP